MTSRSAAFLVLALTGCTMPDLSEDFATVNTLLSRTGATLRTRLGPLADEELKAARDIAFSASEPVVALEGTCDLSAARAAGQTWSDCALVSQVDPGAGSVNATSVLRAVDVLEDYFVALAGLADAKNADEVTQQTRALLSTIEQTGTLQAESFQRLAASAKNTGPLIVKSVDFATKQYQLAQMRRVVRTMDPQIDRLTRIAAAYLDEADGVLAAAQSELDAASIAMNQAILDGNEHAHRDAVVRVENAFHAYKAVEAGASASGLLTLRRLHQDLHQRLSGTGSLKEIDAALRDITEIVAVLTERET